MIIKFKTLSFINDIILALIKALIMFVFILNLINIWMKTLNEKHRSQVQHIYI